MDILDKWNLLSFPNWWVSGISQNDSKICRKNNPILSVVFPIAQIFQNQNFLDQTWD